MISVCGTRKADLAGESASYELALEAGANHVSIVTTHSQGIDRAALYAASDGCSPAFVTCDCGLDTPRIVNNHLLGGMNLISPFEPDDEALRFRCLSRNVLTAALSPLLVVVQAPQRSGSLHCAYLLWIWGARWWSTKAACAPCPGVKGHGHLPRMGVLLWAGILR